MNAVLDRHQQPDLVDPLDGSEKRSRCSGRQDRAVFSWSLC